MTQLDELFEQIGKFVLKQADFTFMRAQTIVKQHTEKLSQIGDIAFPITVQPWLNAIETNSAESRNDLKQIINESETEFARKLCEASTEWMFHIEMVKFSEFRCLLFLNRPKCYSDFLKTVLYDDASYGQWHHHNTNDDNTNYAVEVVKQSNDNSLVAHRLQLITKVLINLLRSSGFEANAAKFDVNSLENNNLTEVLVKSARRDGGKRANRQSELELNNNANRKSITIICGNVTICRPGLTADDFIRLRSLEMEKTAELKHGHNKENVIIDKCQKLGAATVTFDFLKIKHFNTINFEKSMTTPSTIKGAAFILYNVARLQTLLASFDHQVARGFYDPLPKFDQIDFGLLKEEEEWQMFFVYIVGYPNLLERCISGIGTGNIAIHLLCTFLSNLSALFSVYYHRVKILTDNLPQLVPVLYARIYLLKALRSIFLKALAILEIESLDQM
ncbi:DALR anticodon-binding domain-containing protein 3 [Contarinia nasturtii]|uniref:DALR anticodon-binding domain-containing protein 3 n=1 Tax=Contarinia nasturtii TaxID=265458 RepID=UPI0012D49614|nr:DALR anticodon-binding domain-containing protein 3 [Contarinia nasturtii]